MEIKIQIAKKAGFCFGVKRAVELAQEAVYKYKFVYTFGPLIHNPQEVERLAKMGIKPLKAESASANIKDGVLLLRTHGISQELHEELFKRKDIVLIDAICPFVKKAQDIVSKLSDTGDTIIIVGEKAHPEVVALRSYGKNCIVVENVEDVGRIPNLKNVAVVSQTTQTQANFEAIITELKKRAQVKSFNTICKATFERQVEADKIAMQADAMIVVGGRNSGNTTRLAMICEKRVKTYHIESAKDISKDWFKEVRTVGITAGASTPDWVIKEVNEKIEEICNGK
ncbi:MAG: 4-hydroxy-3-methylbut-2-enyl diphosphate reductase [Elusimicrobiota bacterium]|jgi:4-hydroxy-3-methylbut-2-enyl diphosphate reductase|nr:4-hydroxy-3-methylbut-2-enyl diphosphate reductase [Elusimicrobiota bacterium]